MLMNKTIYHWNPIETAPKDGRLILARIGSDYAAVIVWWRNAGSIYAPGWFDGDSWYEDLTEWTNLPE